MNIFNNNNNNNTKEHSPLKHMLHMLLCCGLPIAIIASLPFIARFNPVIAVALGVIAPFICPVMMGGMLLLMFRGKKHSCCEEKKVDAINVLTRNN